MAKISLKAVSCAADKSPYIIPSRKSPSVFGVFVQVKKRSDSKQFEASLRRVEDKDALKATIASRIASISVFVD